MKPFSELWDSFGNFLRRSERLYTILISVVAAGILVHVLLGSGAGQTVLAELHKLAGSQSGLIRFTIWILLSWLVTLLLLRLIHRIRLRLKREDPLPTIVRKGDLTITETSSIRDIPLFSEKLSGLCKLYVMVLLCDMELK